MFDLDISMTTIVYERYSEPLNFIGRRRPAVPEDFAIEGRIQRKGHISEAEDGPGVLAYISGYDDQKFDNIRCGDDARSPCYISMDSVDGNSWSSRIFIRNGLFRHLVELLSTKRIDNVQLLIKLNLSQDNLGTPAFSRGATPDEDRTNFLLSAVKGIEPRDQIETMLGLPDVWSRWWGS
jgi:hypothetical protein